MKLPGCILMSSIFDLQAELAGSRLEAREIMCKQDHASELLHPL